MGKSRLLNASNSSEMASRKPKRRKRSTIDSTLESTCSDYSNLAADLETNEIVGKLRSMDEAERIASAAVLSQVFADPDSNLADENPSLWTDFIARFCDASRNVRLLMVRSCVDIVCSRPEFQSDMSEAVVQRTRDPDEDVRHEAVLAIVSLARHDYNMLTDRMVSALRERILDKKFKIRREVLLALSNFYRDANEAKSEAEQRRFDWIKDKVLHVYYQCGLDDKLLCEKLLYTALVPYMVETAERMDALFVLYCSLDEYAMKAFNEILRQQHLIRCAVKSILDLQGNDEPRVDEQEIAIKTRSLADRFPNSVKSAEQLQEFFGYLSSDARAYQLVKILLGDDFTTTEVQESVKELFLRVGPGSKMAHLQAIARCLLERCAPVIIDAEGIKILLEKAAATLNSAVTIEGVPYDHLLERAFGLLLVISNSFPTAFRSEEILGYLLLFLRHGNPLAARVSLQILSNGAKDREDFFPDSIVQELLPELRELATSGTPEHAKNATICISRISHKIEILRDLLDLVKNDLNLGNERVEAPLAFVTAVAVNEPAEFKRELAPVAMAVVKDIVLNDEYTPVEDDNGADWQPPENLGFIGRAKLAGIKFLPRWIIGQKTNENNNAAKAINLLCAILDSRGDVKKSGKLSTSERAAIRLAASKALLKILQEKAFVNLISMLQYRVIAKVIVDDCRQVRERFAAKLQQALRSLRLPLEFMAVYALVPTLPASNEDDKINTYKQHIKSYVVDNIVRRRQFLRRNPTIQCRPQEFLPEYYLSYVVHLLSYYEKFESYDDLDALRDIQECLWFAMDPVLGHTQDDANSQQFLHKMFQDIKQTRNAENPDDEEQNKKMWAICDLAIVLLSRRIPNFVVKDETHKSLLSKKCFTSPFKRESNTDVYLRKEFLRKKGAETSFDKRTRRSNVSE